MSSIKDIKRFAEMASDLANGRITPRSVVGTGYKDARKVAFLYISDMLLEKVQKLEEETNAI